MEAEMGAYNAAQEAWEDWRSDFKKYLLPSVEFFLDVMIFSLISSLILIPISLLVFFTFIYSESSDSGTFDKTYFLFQLTIFFLSSLVGIIGRSILEGGTVKVVDHLQKGGDYRFFDIVKKGWQNKLNHIMVEISAYLVQVVIILGLTILPFAIITILMLNFIDSLFIILLLSLLLLIIILIMLIPLSIFLSPLVFLSFRNHMNEGSSGISSVGKSLSYMIHNKKETFILGGIFLLFALVGSMIPFAGLLIASAGNIFMYQMVCKMFPKI